MLLLAPPPAPATVNPAQPRGAPAQGKAQPVQTAPFKNNYFPAVLDNWILKISTISFFFSPAFSFAAHHELQAAARSWRRPFDS